MSVEVPDLVSLFFLIFILSKTKKKNQKLYEDINKYLPQSKISYQINLSNVNAMVIYVTCREPEFPANKLKIPSMNITCNKQLNHLPCKEAFTMLDFIIKYYKRFPAEKLIFIHGHDRSWHYRSSVIDAINNLINTDKFKNSDYGGIYRGWWHYHTDFQYSDERGLMLQEMFKEIYYNTSVFKYFRGHSISFPCCSTFSINTSLINNNPLSLYKLIRERLLKWTERKIKIPNGNASLCGYFMEYTWSMLFNHPYISSNTAVAA